MSATATQYKILIGGDFADAASGETMEVIAPATGETIAEVPRCGAEDVDRAVEAARAAAPEWLEKTPKERSELLHKLADVMDEHAEELAQLAAPRRLQAVRLRQGHVHLLDGGIHAAQARGVQDRLAPP
jgi:acyl-CoA reductase-like NAD-dependent aldehyde dehydrogenase